VLFKVDTVHETGSSTELFCQLKPNTIFPWLTGCKHTLPSSPQSFLLSSDKHLHRYPDKHSSLRCYARSSKNSTDAVLFPGDLKILSHIFLAMEPCQDWSFVDRRLFSRGFAKQPISDQKSSKSSDISETGGMTWGTMKISTHTLCIANQLLSNWWAV
jgi:hypothetical protein